MALIIITLVLAWLIIWVGDILISKTFKIKVMSGRKILDERRGTTLRTLLKSVLQYTVFFIAAITILDELGVPVTAVLSAAGILGLAVGFGAQSLVKDIITGFFILFEDQFAVGEYIETEGVGGIVEEVGLRITKLRDWGGQLHIIPNGKITMVTNHNRGSLRALVEVEVAYEENLDKVIKVLNGINERIAQDYKGVVTWGPKVQGVQSLRESGIVVRVTAKTKPLEQWGVEMELRKRIKEEFDKEGIEIAYPRRVMVNPGEKVAGTVHSSKDM
jgi:small conductance mechanosensitive channel